MAFLIIFFVSICIISIVGYLLWKQTKGPQIRISANLRQAEHAQMIDDHICCICLNQPKQLKVAATCGHSFCGQCVVQIYEAKKQRINCPLCRKTITTLFKLFRDEEPRDKIQKIRQKLTEYNSNYADDRGLIRSLIELPNVIEYVFKTILNVRFLYFLLGSSLFLKMIFGLILYIASPLDLLPQRWLGKIGYLDDSLATIIGILLTLTKVALNFMRREA